MVGDHIGSPRVAFNFLTKDRMYRENPPPFDYCTKTKVGEMFICIFPLRQKLVKCFHFCLQIGPGTPS